VIAANPLLKGFAFIPCLKKSMKRRRKKIFPCTLFKSRVLLREISIIENKITQDPEPGQNKTDNKTKRRKVFAFLHEPTGTG
jgi:hypothetical protein